MDKGKCGNIYINYDCCEAGGNDIEPISNNYSFEETVCGYWVDGKPIYRKVIEGTLANASGTSLLFADLSELNIDRTINIHGNFKDNAEGEIMIQTSFNTPSTVCGVNMIYHNKRKELRYDFLNNQGIFADCTVYVVLEYTKM